MSTELKHTPELTFDGCGINAANGERLCTFPNALWNNKAKKLGPLFASAKKVKKNRDELVKACELFLEGLEMKRSDDGGGRVWKNGQGYCEIAEDMMRQAIANATTP